MHLNCRSVNGKLDQIGHILHTVKPDILVLTETWLDSSNPKGTLKFGGYKQFRRDRNQTTKEKYGKKGGGGVAVLYKENLKIKQLSDIGRECDEIMWLSIGVRRATYIIGAVYRPDYSDFLDGDPSPLEEQLQAAFQRSSNVIVIGDLNVDLLGPTRPVEARNKEKLTEIMTAYGMEQSITRATRVTSNKSSLIDHIWMTNSCNAVKSDAFVGLSDHHGIFVEIKQIDKTEPKKITVRIYKNYDKEKFIQDYKQAIAKSDFNELLLQQRLNEAIQLWSDTVAQLCDKHAPEKVVKLKSDTEEIPWYTEEIESLQAEKNEILADHRKTKDDHTKNILRNITNKLKYLKQKRRRQFFAEKIEEQEGNPKRLWSLLREVSRTEQVIEDVIPENSNTEKADEFNLYFATIGKQIQDELAVSFTYSMQDNPNQGFNFKNETPEEITKIIDSIKAKVATGQDRIPARILKDLNTTANQDICSLINLSYQTKTFPHLLKKALIKPIFKNKGSSHSPEFYRPHLHPLHHQQGLREVCYQTAGQLYRTK